jgi:hypothetical protein
MAGSFCQHNRIWTTCPECGKDVIKAASKNRKKSDDVWDEPRVVPARRAKPPPDEPPATEFEESEA